MRYDKEMKLSALIILAVTFVIGGCSTEKRTYELAVKNESSKPITIGTIKDGPSDETWISPEELAISHAREGDQLWGRVVKPGQTATTGEITGTFERTDSAW